MSGSVSDINELLVRLLSGETITPAETARFDAWLAESPENRARVEEMRATWRMLGHRALDLPPYQPIDLPERAPRRTAPVIGRITRRRRPAWIAAGLAAALASVVVARTIDREAPVEARTYATTTAETSSVRLEDGTLVRLGPGSRLEVSPGSGGRDVRLQGQAFFAVTRRTDQPFRVHTSAGDVKVLGTRFNVSSGGARTDLVVVDGRVELSAGARRVEVVGGQVSRAERGEVAPATTADVYAMLGWMEGTLMFNATPLPRVADEIAHRFGVHVEIDSAVKGHTVTAVFTNRRLSEVLDVVCNVVDAKCEVSRDGAHARIGAQERTK
jgi:transmembrane sensor